MELQESDDQPEPTVLVLVGLPCSGKTTFAERLVAASAFRCVNQEELGSRLECRKRTQRLLREGHSLVVDRCNHTRKQRQPFVAPFNSADGQRLAATAATAAPRFAVDCVVFDVDKATCVRRAQERTDHPTLASAEARARAVKCMVPVFEPPTAEDGFRHIYRIQSDSDAARVLEQVLERSGMTRGAW